jgi:hypothetical protein
MNKKGFLFGILMLFMFIVMIGFIIVMGHYLYTTDNIDDFQNHTQDTLDTITDKFNMTDVDIIHKKRVEVDTTKNSTLLLDFVDHYGERQEITLTLYDDYITYYEEQDINLKDSNLEFYPKFFAYDEGEDVFDTLINISANRTDGPRDQLLFLMYMVSDIEYKYEDEFFHPYTILHNNFGACTDKSFLMVEFLGRLGYGTALLDFPLDEHMTAAIKCTTPTHGEYCILDTTNGFVFIGDDTRNLTSGPLEDEFEIITLYDGATYNSVDDVNEAQFVINQVARYNELKRIVNETEIYLDELSIAIDDCYAGEPVPGKFIFGIDENNPVPDPVHDDICGMMVDKYNNDIESFNADLDEGQSLELFVHQYPMYLGD